MTRGGRTLAYDSENRPTSITQGDITTTFAYDSDDARVKKLVGTTTITYLGNLYDCEDTGSDPQCVKYIFAGSQRIAMKQVSSGTVDYYHPDHLGSTSVMTTAAGVQEEGLTYYPYGAIRTDTGTTNMPYKYTGQELDASTGLYFYEARYYDAELGRFISADSLVPNPHNPQDLNRYSYVRNNPLRYTDPTGRCPELEYVRHLFWCPPYARSRSPGAAHPDRLGLYVRLRGGHRSAAGDRAGHSGLPQAIAAIRSVR